MHNTLIPKRSKGGGEKKKPKLTFEHSILTIYPQAKNKKNYKQILNFSEQGNSETINICILRMSK